MRIGPDCQRVASRCTPLRSIDRRELRRDQPDSLGFFFAGGRHATVGEKTCIMVFVWITLQNAQFSEVLAPIGVRVVGHASSASVKSDRAPFRHASRTASLTESHVAPDLRSSMLRQRVHDALARDSVVIRKISFMTCAYTPKISSGDSPDRRFSENSARITLQSTPPALWLNIF